MKSCLQSHCTKSKNTFLMLSLKYIVAHLPDEEKALCVKAVKLVAGTKDQLRGSDYREMCVVLA